MFISNPRCNVLDFNERLKHRYYIIQCIEEQVAKLTDWRDGEERTGRQALTYRSTERGLYSREKRKAICKEVERE